MSEPKSNYVDHVMSLLGLRKEADEDQPAVPSRPAIHRQPENATTEKISVSQSQRDGEVFDQRLEEFVAQVGSGGSLVTGRVHMINVDKVREHLGDRWPKFAERVHETIKAELKIRLSSRDMFRRMGDDSYVIVFGDCPEAEARLKIALLSEQILEKLLGEEDAKDLRFLGVQRLVTKADGSVAVEALESTDALVAMLDEAQRAGEQASTFDYSDVAAGRRALTPEEVARLMGEVDRELASLENDAIGSGSPVVKIDRLQGLLRQLTGLEDAMRAKMPAFVPTEDKNKAKEFLAKIDNVKSTLEKIKEMKGRAEQRIVFLYDRDPTTAEQPNSEISLKVDFSYQPMWNAPSNKVAVYVCTAMLRDGDGKALKLAGVGKDQEADVFAIVDRLALRKVKEDLDVAVAQGIPNIVMVPVQFSTLHRHSSRISLLELCSHLPEMQKNVLSWEIVGSHNESWSLQLKSVIKPIIPYGRAIFLRIANLQTDFSGVRRNLPYLRAAGVHAVGVDISTLHGSEADKLQLLDKLAELTEKSGLKCYGHGFHSLSMTICAVCMGYQSISGPAIAEPTQRPEGVRATEMENVYGRGLFKDVAQSG